MLRICIVTPDLRGFVRNGGVGTACAELALALASTGHEVTVLFSQTGAHEISPDERGRLLADYRAAGVEVVIAEIWARTAGGTAFVATLAEGQQYPHHPLLRMSRIVHGWLGQCISYNLVLFMDWQGAGFYAQTARRGGFAHDRHGAFMVVCHGPTLWSDLGNAARWLDPLDAITYFIERRSIELAEAVISPSAYLLDWLKGQGYRLPRQRRVLPNLLEVPGNRATPAKGNKPNELVFFGRLEYRKGLVQFCAAIDRMIAAGNAPPAVTFLGKFGFVGSEHAALYLARRIKDWPMPVNIVSRMGQAEALVYLIEHNCLAVVPSTVENAPYTVYECLTAGVPIIARQVGGIPELYDQASRQSHLFDDNPASLAALMTRALKGDLPAAHLGFDPVEAYRQWTEELPKLAARLAKSRRKSQSAAAAAGAPLVSLCLTHFQRPALLKQALAGIERQDYPAIEVILVDDGSADRASLDYLASLEPQFKKRNWTIIHTDNGFPGRARNLAAAASNGKYLLFMDDDNVPMPGMVRAYVRAAEMSGVPIVSSFSAVFKGTSAPDHEVRIAETYMPVGGGIGYALYGNALADNNALIEVGCFRRLGGYTEDYGLGHEDMELFLRAALAGDEILILPEPLYWYRQSVGTINNATPDAANRSRSLRPFLEHQRPDMVELLVVAHGRGDIPLPQTETGSTADFLRGHERILHDYDPNSWQATDAAALTLASQGRFALAAGMLAQLPPDQPKAEIRAVMAAAFQQLAEGSVVALPEVLAAGELTEGQHLELLSLFTQLVAQQDPSQAQGLAMAWCRQQPEALTPYLLLLEALLPAGNLEQVLRVYLAALVAAERQYRQRRPDIDQAVVRGDFASGLEHYARHGRAEQAPWPEVQRFAHLTAGVRGLLADRVVSNANKDGAMINAAFTAFAAQQD
jgi:GT2 family glycosyltransferase/glycosyltransferase involved in cell wall biosynthesis